MILRSSLSLPFGGRREGAKLSFHHLKKQTIMDIKIQLSDAVYQRLMTTGSRVQGTIGLVSPAEGNFNEHNKSVPAPGSRHMKLPHGRASVTDKQVRLTLRVGLDEVKVIPAQAIEEESRQAAGFVDEMLDMMIGY